MVYGEDPAFSASVRAQREALSARVLASGMYLHEVEEFELLTRVIGHVARLARVEQDLGSLTTPESRNLVRLVRRDDGSQAVLKLIGNDREPGEGPVLSFWHERGLPCARPLVWGNLPVQQRGCRGTVTYLLTEYLPCPSLPPADGRPARDRLAALEALTRLVDPFHVPIDELPADVLSAGRTWADRMLAHLRWTMPLVRARSLPEPDGWEEALGRLSWAEHPVLLHGDPSPGNVLDCGGRLVLLDPPGAVLGPIEADVGHLCAHLGGQHHVEVLLDWASRLDRRLDPDLMAFFAGVDFLLWSGYLIGSHSSPHLSAGSAAGDAAVTDMLGLAARLMLPATGPAAPWPRP